MTQSNDDRAHWARVAAEWVAWARAPDHDSFWAYRDPLLAFVGRGGGRALEVGCGEGRISRALMECGYRVTATDPIGAMVDAAAGAGSAHEYAVAAATALPFGDACFDLVMAYNMLMDVEDVPATVREIRRVMRPTARLVVSIVHPIADHGRFAGDAADAPFVIPDGYFGRRRFADVEERDGLRMRFAGWSQPLEAYAAALADAGLAITSIREPVPTPGTGPAHIGRWNRIPLFLWLEARPLAA